MMNGTAYQRWWELHVRVARGDRLSPEDRAVYDTTRRELEESEALQPLQSAKHAQRNCASWSCNAAGWNTAAKNSTLKLPLSRALSRRKPGSSLARRSKTGAASQARSGAWALGGSLRLLRRSEEDVGGDLTVDHFVPVVAGGDDSDENLGLCVLPLQSLQRGLPSHADGPCQIHIVLHPLRDVISKHVPLEATTGRCNRSRKPGASILRFCISTALRFSLSGLGASSTSCSWIPPGTGRGREFGTSGPSRGRRIHRALKMLIHRQQDASGG